ncbi:MAG: LAGLIDADG family homing endonuclease, partial [bacterium]|nr:LAGLIDADG family homing endonuclease [bacterium]
MALPFFKKKPIEIPEKIFETETVVAKDIVAPASIEVSQKNIRIGERLAKSFFIFSFPRYLSTGWFYPVINLDTPMDVAFHLHPVSSEKILQQLRKKVTEVQAELMEREEKGLIRDPSLETAYQDIETLRDSLQTAQEKMFQVGLYLTIYGENEKELRDTETILRSILEGRLIYIKPALFQQKEGFVSTCPYGLDVLQVHNPMNTEPLSSVFPFVSSDLSSNEGILYGINMHNKSLVLFDRFSLENANMTIFSKSGGGKSVLGSEPVLIKTNNGIQLAKIGSLVEGLIKQKGLTKIDEELEGVIAPDLKVFSFDKNLKGSWSEVTVAARKKASDVFYKFTTRSGREITTTPDHNILVLKDGKVVATKSSEIKEGEFIPLPRKIIETDNASNSFNLLDLLKNSSNVYIAGGKKIIQENYDILHKITINNSYDRYLYQYRDGRPIPISYFWKILNYLGIKSDDPGLQALRLTSKNGKNRTLFDINFHNSSSFLKILGYVTAEGTICENCVMISNIDPEFLKDASNAFSNLAIQFYYGNRGIISGSRVFIEIIKVLCGREKSGQKKIPGFVFNLEKEKIAQFLSAYFEGDSGVEKNKITITAVSKSRRLISEIAYLLYYFGIIGRISKTKKEPANYGWKQKKTYWKLSISGQDNLRKFASNINFVSERKRKQLSEITKKEGNTNVDVIPGLEQIFSEIYNIFSFQLHGIPEISEWKRGITNPSPQRLLKVTKEIEARIESFKDLTSTFKILSELPELATIINLGKNNKKLNGFLWKTVGPSWRLMKNQVIKPGIINTLKALNVIERKNYSMKEIKEKIYSGFQEMDLPVKYYNLSLQTALMDRPESNTSYEMIQKAAQHVWQNYQDILINKIPQVEEKIAQLKTLANSSLFWDPITQIKKIQNKKEKYVYDLTVDNEVFLAGQGGMFVHNSYMVKLEVLRSLMQGVDVIVVDPENEYQNLVDAAGGSFFSMSLASPNHINPFDLPIPREDEKPEDVLRSNIINLVGLLRIMLGGLNPEEDAIIDRALTETYAAKDITQESDPAGWQDKIPLMSDFEQILENMEGAESIVRRVRKFTKGTFADFFNQPTNISMQKSLVVFGIRDMEDELRPMAMFMIMRYIWNKIRSELKKRILVIDEAWWLMQTEDGASFLFGLAKRARKYWLGVTTITQDVSDFMKSEYGQPIIANSSMQLLLKQSSATIDAVQKAFNLTEEEKMRLLEASVGEGIFFAGQKHVAIKVMASYAEDQFITTAPEEVLK